MTDSSLLQVNCPGYVIISVKPSCFAPSQITDNRAAVVLLQDVLLDEGTVCLFSLIVRWAMDEVQINSFKLFFLVCFTLCS